MTSPGSLLELRDVLVERGGVAVLDIPSFHLGEGEIVALVGPNGSGKSSLLLTLMALLERRRGALLHRGKEIRSGRDALECRRRMAMVLQEPLLFDTSVHANVAAALKFRGLPRGEVRRRVASCLERLGVAHLADRSARKLSGGEARRVSVARALAVEPDVLFLDEPFTNLDPPTRQAILDDLERTLAASRTAAILITHERDEAFRLADRLVVMDGGKIVQSGPPQELLDRPENPFVASFVGMETILHGVVARREGAQVVVDVAGVELRAAGDAPPGQRVHCCIRAEKVTLVPQAAAGAARAANQLPGAVVAISSAGPFTKLKVQGAFALTAYVTAEAFAAGTFAKGAAVLASFDAGAVHLIPDPS